MRLRAPFLFLFLLLPGSVLAATERVVEWGVVRDVVDGDTLILENGEAVRLAGIQAPTLSLGRVGVASQPLAGAAKKALADLALGRKIQLHFFGRHRDRHGRLLAHLFVSGHDRDSQSRDSQSRDDGEWLQGKLLERGLARVYSFADNRVRIAAMLALERKARAEKRGIWAHPFYRVLDVDGAAGHLSRFALVTGRVQKALVVKGRGYLNFGDDWRTDFTIAISPKARRVFERDGIDIRAYADKHVRVRGWVKRFNGPMIEVTHPEQIEILEQ